MFFYRILKNSFNNLNGCDGEDPAPEPTPPPPSGERKNGEACSDDSQCASGLCASCFDKYTDNW